VDSNGNIYAGKVDTVYKSIDAGATWASVYTVPGSPSQIRRVFVDSRNYVYVSGYGGSSDWGLYRSTNGGASWTKAITNDTNCDVWGIDEDASGNLYVGEYSWSQAGATQIWKSTDGGANWTQKYTLDLGAGSQDHVHDLRVDPSSGWIYAVLGDETPIILIRSKDSGENWSQVVMPFGTYQMTTISFAHGYIYLGTDAPGDFCGIYRFQDDGTAGEQDLTLVYTYPGSYADAAVYCAGEYGDKVFFGTWDNIKDTCILVYDGSDWTTPYTNAAFGWSGYWAVSRHHRGGVFYFNHGNNYGIKFAP
jgi:photosystem II stability/assembly factor-like uncharacterized protein